MKEPALQVSCLNPHTAIAQLAAGAADAEGLNVPFAVDFVPAGSPKTIPIEPWGLGFHSHSLCSFHHPLLPM